MADDADLPTDASPTMHDPKTQTRTDLDARVALEQYYASSPGSDTEKLENFAKYVPRNRTWPGSWPATSCSA